MRSISLLFFLTIALLYSVGVPSASAQASCAGLTGTRLAQCQASAPARQRYSPSATIQGQKTYGGISFSGVGGALAGCTDAGGRILNGINSLGRQLNIQIDGLTGSSVPIVNKADDQRENCLNGVAYAVAKGMLQQVTNKTLNWVNTGFAGNKMYVSDIGSYFSTISSQSVNSFLQQVPSRNPIFGNAIRSIATEQISGIQDGLINSVMDTQEARDYAAFQDNFTNGGWKALLDPDNNAIGALIDAGEEISLDIGTKQEDVTNQQQRNNGFLDLKRCVEEKPKYDDSIIAYCGELSPDERRFSNCPSEAEIAAAESAPKECVRWETVTPGSLVQERAAEVTNTDIRQLEQADEINEVLGSFFDQLLNRIFAYGLSSVSDRSLGSFSYSGVGTNVVLGTNGLPLSSINSGGVGMVGGSGYSTMDFDISRPQQIRAILEAQYDYLNRAQDTAIALARIVPTLGALDYCIPGPNPTWKEGLNDNSKAYFGTLQEVQKGSNIFDTLANFVPLLNFFTGNQSHTIAAVNTQLGDKASGQVIQISNTIYYERNRSTLAIFENVQRRYNEVLDYYNANYTNDIVKNAFISADAANVAFATGFAEDALTETAKLSNYNQNINVAGLQSGYSRSITQTRASIRELESIKTEVNEIVRTAKARYVAERQAAGTPVKQSCLDDAYQIDTSAIVPVARQESDTPSPFEAPSAEANTYFYTQL